MMSKLRMFILGMTASTILAGPLRSEVPEKDAMLQQFEQPPLESHPRVWWHWMNGNITKDGLAKDLEWMQRIGIGGVQIFDANLATPQVVQSRLIYMTSEWKDAFRFAVSKAAASGMEVAIAASPGWSETGGPWVPPEDGMKKLVWSEQVLTGGKRFAGRLPEPSSLPGPYAGVAIEEDVVAAAPGEKQFEPPALYRDVAVYAYRIAAQNPLPRPESITADGKPLDLAALSDDSLGTAATVSRGSADKPTTLVASYNAPQQVRSVSFFAPGAARQFGAAGYLAKLEASDDGVAWRKVSDLALTQVPTTVSFAPVTARQFRMVLSINPSGGLSGFTPAAGVDLRPVLAALAPKSTLPIAEFRLSNEARVHQFEAKAGYAMALDFAALNRSRTTEKGLAKRDIVNLTARLGRDGSLNWTPPAGNWRVVRMGWSLTGKANHPAPFEATGLEVDKLDSAAVRRYLGTYLAKYRDAAGPGISALLTDSTEVGAFNWTPRMVEQFTRLRGYDPSPWLPVLTGAVIGDAAQSDAFLYDYRRTIADLHATEHYGTVAAFAHENGLKVYGEALEDRRPSLGDDMSMRKNADYPMAALWTWQRGEKPRSTLLGDLKGASSVAHLYGQNIAAAESMTSALQYWAQAPSDLRRVIDLEFAQGINRPIIHSSVHQPVDDKQPGMSLLIFGQYFNRHETWAEMAKPWVDYIARSSFMLQQGRNHADLAYFYGEDTPLTALYAEAPLTDVPTRYAYDFVNADALVNVLKVQGGELAAPSGARYRALYLGGTSRRMTLPVLRRIAALAKGGATIIGTAPTGSPALNDDAREYVALVAKLWSGQPVTVVGKGRVIAQQDPEQALQQAGVAPDFEYIKSAKDSEVLFVHRKLADGDVYFVNNRLNRGETTELRFRVSGLQPELWRADTGTSKPVSYRIEGGVTVVPLTMEAEDSFFIVFRKPAKVQSLAVDQPQLIPVATLDTGWNVTFQPGRGAPASVMLDKLASLSLHSDAGVKHFSGTATYTRSFNLPEASLSAYPYLLDVGAIGDVAEVSINGRKVGTLWHAPYQLDISDFVRPGTNAIEVRVANLWVNRLIGDAKTDAAKVTFTTLSTYMPGAPLRPSGLLGPVQVLTVKR
jgi:hypothetical protein